MTVVSPCTQKLMDSAHPHTVLCKLDEQRSQGLFCDVTIVVEDVKFRAHKNILAACSGYFRNALTTSETWSSGQVLELMDLKSEVFATILNFIYCSKVTSPGTEDTRRLIAAGKRLGIPFLEKLTEHEKQERIIQSNDCYTAPVSKNTKKEVSRLEEIDTARGPRITNAFSITEVCPGNNPFTPTAQTNNDRQSPDTGQLPSNCPTTSYFNGSNEPSHTLSEHSYAVSKSTESKDSSQCDSKKFCKPVVSHPKQLIYRSVGPLKKRHRLTGILSRSVLPTPAEIQKDEPNAKISPLSDSVAGISVAVTTPPPLFSEIEAEKSPDTQTPNTTDNGQMELGPPTLSPHTEDSITIYSCEHCPEIFTNNALLTIHSDVHKKRFISHLFCKFCHRKFIHLKRLRNHEQVCSKARRRPSNHYPRNSLDKGTDPTEEGLDKEGVVSQLPSPSQSSPFAAEHLQEEDLSKFPQEEKPPRTYSTQRRYNCSMCKRVYVTLSSLKRHENVHSWQRAYPCHYCNKVFALAEYRTKHEIWHTGERRYQCIFCLETFMTYYILKNHQKSFHGIDPSLAVKKKSANGGFKASVYPIKLYRLLPMKFRKRQYKTYSQTYSESVERPDQSLLSSNSLIPPFEDNLIGQSDTAPFPLTFMATTKTISPVMPRISLNKPCDQDMDHHLSSGMDICGAKRKEAERGDPASSSYESNLSSQSNTECSEGYNDDPPVLIKPEQIGHGMPFLKSLSAVTKLGELSASAKRVEDMTKEILQTGTESLLREKNAGAKTETYIAKPACPGPSVDSDALPLCQITVKIGNEAIIRRQIKGSNLFPRRKKKSKGVNEDHSPRQCHQTREKSESPRLRFRTEATARSEAETNYDHNECDTADKLWRPYYSYKSKKKRKKLRYKHRKALLHHFLEASGDKSSTSDVHPERSSWPTYESVSGAGTGHKHNLSRNCSTRATYNCDICDSSFITETGLKAHVIGSHPCFCRTCGKQGPPGEAPASGDYICSNCMENGSCFDNTPRSHNPEKRYRCSFCPQRFLYLATKRSHEKKHQGTNEGYNYDDFKSRSKLSAHLSDDGKQATIKTEEVDNQDVTEIKYEIPDEGHFSGEKNKSKPENTTDFISLNAFKDVPFSSIKSPQMPNIDPLFSLTPSKVKHKMAKQRLNTQQSLYFISKKQAACEREREKDSSVGSRPNSQSTHEKICKPFGQSDNETAGAHISVHKPEKYVCKEEPFF